MWAIVEFCLFAGLALWPVIISMLSFTICSLVEVCLWECNLTLLKSCIRPASDEQGGGLGVNATLRTFRNLFSPLHQQIIVLSKGLLEMTALKYVRFELQRWTFIFCYTIKQPTNKSLNLFSCCFSSSFMLYLVEKNSSFLILEKEKY